MLQAVARIGISHGVVERASRAGRCRAVTGEIPPGAESVVPGHAGGKDAQHIKTLLDGIRLYRDGKERVGRLRVDSDLVVGRAHRACRAIDDHQALHPFGIAGGQNQRRRRGEAGGEHRGPLASRRIHDRDRVLGPELGTEQLR
ncbi:hypothetical protein NIIDMKKI_73920 [Mycobacterium kansasii]|uniref:Uncharacterized protein n=1 Tax=Mycobacterium kansasii TaxID=1768 RepID=A0A7G1IMF4_MYCKA|nr:hypothetical protein NIIDMKKI_73920 [Mycobacterium kansasii]